jgi:hypothetical protein
LVTLETGLIIGVGVVAGILIGSPATAATGSRWREVASGAAMVAVLVFALWPGALVKMSLVKTVALYLYRLKLGDEYASVPGRFADLAWALLPMWFPTILVCSWLFLANYAKRQSWGPYALIGGIYALALLRFALSPSYVIAGFGPLICVSGYVVDHVRSVRLQAMIIGACVWATGVTAAPILTSRESGLSSRDDFEKLKEVLRGREALIDGGHIYQYYLGPRYMIRSVAVGHDGRSLSVRERGAYRKLQQPDLIDRLVVIQKDRRIGGPLGSLLEHRPRTDLNHVSVYDCR